MSGKASEGPEGSKAPASAVPLMELYDEEFENKMKGKATFWKNYLAKEIPAQILDAPKHKKFLEKSGIRAKWEGKLESTNKYENFDVGTLQDVVALHAEYTEFKKDIKQIDVWEKKVSLLSKKDEMKKATEEMGEASSQVGELGKKLEELKEATEKMVEATTKLGEFKDKIGGLQDEIEQLDKDLYEARESRKDEDRFLVRRLKEYLTEIRLPNLPPEDLIDKSATPPLSPEADLDSEFSRASEAKKSTKSAKPAKPAKEEPPKKKGKKAATVTDASD